jgi:hypothetical protein
VIAEGVHEPEYPGDRSQEQERNVP